MSCSDKTSPRKAAVSVLSQLQLAGCFFNTLQSERKSLRWRRIRGRSGPRGFRSITPWGSGIGTGWPISSPLTRTGQYALFLLTARTVQSWAPALFSRFRAFALASAKLNKKRASARKKSAKKSESAERERKKSANSRFFCLGGGTFLCMYVCMYVFKDVHIYVGMYVFK